MQTIKVKGMSCNHCKMAVTKALSGLEGVSDVAVSLEKGEASFSASVAIDPEVLKKVIHKAGFELE